MPVIRRRLPEPPPELISITKPPYSSPFASVEEAAVYLHVSTKTVREYVHRKILQVVPHPDKPLLAKPWRLLYSELDKHIAQQLKTRAA